MKPYRNQKLRDAAKDVPHCFYCGAINYGQVVGCHSNAIRDGHGVSQKAHDLLLYACDKCHKHFDEHWKEPGVQKDFYKGVYDSTVWLLQEGYLK